MGGASTQGSVALELPNREKVLAAYAEGPEAVVALVEGLVAVIMALVTRVEALESQLAKDSHNSSKPPSSDGLAKKPSTRTRKPSGKPSGGQPGHPGHTLSLCDNPTETEVRAPQQCAQCGASLADVQAIKEERRQVVDLPEIKLVVKETLVQTKECPCCGHHTSEVFPAEFTQPVQYGERIRSSAVYLTQYQLLPSERATQLLEDLCNAPLSEGTLYAAVGECAERLEPVEKEIKEALKQAEVAHFDETGARVEGKGHWLHVVGTTALTHYTCHTKRGKVAMDEIGILPEFQGRAVHDGLSSYQQYENCAHGLCNAHHLRELTFVEEVERQAWAARMKDLLLEAKGKADEAKAAGQKVLPPPEIAEVERRYQEILDEGFAANPAPEVAATEPKKRGRRKQSKPKNLLDRLDGRREQVLAFLYDFRVPFDNNLAERDLRMVKVQQKVSGCFRTQKGADAFCRIRGYISSMRKQGRSVFAALESVFHGAPLRPDLGA